MSVLSISKLLVPFVTGFLFFTFSSLRIWCQITEEKTTVFIGVNVIPMDKERVLQNQTVIVQKGIITKIGNAKKVKIPPGAVKIDGKGKFLIPGLVDAHVHLRQTDEKGLIQYLAAGITTVRDMNGRPFLLEWRNKIKNGSLLGPALYVASPTIGNFSSPREGYSTPKTADEADAMVKKFAGQGYDLIKVYSFVPRNIYLALVKAAAKYKIPISGHPPLETSFEESLRMKSIEHLLGYLEPLMTPQAAELDKKDLRGVFHAVEFDESKLPNLAEKTRQAGVWNCPTILFFDHRVPTEQVRAAWEQPELRKLGHQNRIKIVRALHRAGARLLVCTDSDAGRNLPADSINEELGNMFEAGLTPYEVLQAGTRNAAEFLESKDFGTITVGKRADLLLVECNPLKDLNCMAKQNKIMIRGRLFTKQKLAELSKIE